MKKIIIVEDINILELQLERIFRKNSMDNFEAKRTVDITDNYLTFGIPDPGVFIVDLDSVEVTGIELIERIRSSDKSKQVPILGMSRNADIKLLKKAMLAGCSDFVIKPFDSHIIVYKVNKLLGLTADEAFSPNRLPVAINEADLDSQFIWDKEFEMGIPEIDEEHRSIVERYKRMYTLMKEGKGHAYYQELLLFLTEYVDSHFAHEEALHREYAFPLAQQHYEIHEAFKETVRKLYMDGNGKVVSDLELVKLNMFIRNWLVHHLLVEDQKFGAYIKE